MRDNIYAVYDSAIGAYMQPFFCPSDAAAVRAFSDIAVDKKHPIGQHPECYTLMRIGTYENQQGQVVGEVATTIATALEMVAATQRRDIADTTNDQPELPLQ